MTFARPTIQQILSRIQADVESRLVGSNPRLRRNLLAIIARMQAGIAHGLYGDIEWCARKLLPDTDDPEILAQWAAIFGVARLDATAATGSVTFTGTDESVVPAGTLLIGSNGLDYELQADVVLEDGAGVGVLVALSTGVASNLSTGSTLTTQEPVPGVSSTATILAPGLVGGADLESPEAWRDRLLERIQKQPEGGAAHDYVSWAKEAHPSVTDVWVYENADGGGTVTVRFMTYGATSDGIPAAPVVEIVDAYIQSRRPVTAVVTVIAPTAQPLDLVFDDLSPNTDAVRTAIQAEIRALLRREAEPGVDMPLTHIDEAASAASDEYDHVLADPSANVTVPAGSILVPGTFTWP